MKAEWNKTLNIFHTGAKDLFEQVEEPWEVLPLIHDFVENEIEKRKEDPDYRMLEKGVLVHKSVNIAKLATLCPPVLVEEGTEIRPGAFIRGNAFIGKDCVVGNSTELKNVILFDRVQVPHYNYVGDSVLGYRSHMGAGSITSNVKSDRTLIVLHPEQIHTGLKKMGAILGERCEIGCGCVLNPGVIVGSDSIIYPLNSVRQRVPSRCIYKKEGDVVPRQMTDEE